METLRVLARAADDRFELLHFSRRLALGILAQNEGRVDRRKRPDIGHLLHLPAPDAGFEQLRQRNRLWKQRHRRAVTRRLRIEIVGCDDAAATRLAFDQDLRRSRQLLAQEICRKAGVEIIAAARRMADHDRNTRGLVEVFRRGQLGRRRPRTQCQTASTGQQHVASKIPHASLLLILGQTIGARPSRELSPAASVDREIGKPKAAVSAHAELHS